jgi:hypothetical protein
MIFVPAESGSAFTVEMVTIDPQDLQAAQELDPTNQSRSFDATRCAVRFWGRDGAMEASFFVTDEALRRITPNMQFDESGILSAFDLNRKLIYAIAAKVYERGRKGSYELAADF